MCGSGAFILLKQSTSIIFPGIVEMAQIHFWMFLLYEGTLLYDVAPHLILMVFGDSKVVSDSV